MSKLPVSLECPGAAKAVRTGGYGKTGVPGVFVAGDASRHVQFAIVAAGEGAAAAFAINSELLKEDIAGFPQKACVERDATATRRIEPVQPE
jgi:pyruvate/2-oxoglutarate dehydrogenase complex dihydrolipoamide dehydrogenase (E3) component